jgi:hypothetical protein
MAPHGYIFQGSKLIEGFVMPHTCQKVAAWRTETQPFVFEVKQHVNYDVEDGKKVFINGRKAKLVTSAYIGASQYHAGMCWNEYRHIRDTCGKTATGNQGQKMVEMVKDAGRRWWKSRNENSFT